MFGIGDSVQFNDTRRAGRGAMVRGTVTAVGRGARGRFTVETTDGRTFQVPAAMLSAAPALDSKQVDRALERGAAKEQVRADHRQARTAARAAAFEGHCAAFMVGERVKVLSRGQWQAATVVEILSATGQIKTTNPTQELVEQFGAISGRRFQDTIIVLANRVRKL